MTDFNQAIILGNLTRDPEFRYTPNGQAVASFSVATNRRWTTAEGQQGENTQFHNIVAWGKLAEICNKILYKGRKTLVVGRIQTRSWDGQDGVKHYITEIVADQISATGSPKAQGEEAINSSQSNYAKPTNYAKPAPAKPVAEKPQASTDAKEENKEDINLDDIPF